MVAHFQAAARPGGSGFGELDRRKVTVLQNGKLTYKAPTKECPGRNVTAWKGPCAATARGESDKGTHGDRAARMLSEIPVHGPSPPAARDVPLHRARPGIAE